MSYIHELDSLLEKIKKSHFETVHKLSELYKKSEKLINEVKAQGEGNIDDAMQKLKALLSESSNARDEQVNNMTDYFQTLFKTVLKNINPDSCFKASGTEKGNGNSGSEFEFPEIGSFEGFFGLKLEKEDTDKLYEITKNSLTAMYTLFHRMGELISEETGKDKSK